jgi:hypothetical protein
MSMAERPSSRSFIFLRVPTTRSWSGLASASTGSDITHPRGYPAGLMH